MQHEMLPTDLSDQEIEIAHKIAAKFPANLKLCRECVAEGKKSRLVHNGGTVTAMNCRAFWDGEGHPHFHDGNIRTNFYHCTNGHRYSEQADKAACPTCGKDWHD